MYESINVNDFQVTIIKALEEYSEEENEKVKKVIDDLAKDVISSLRNNPVIPEKTGEYKKSFFLRKRFFRGGYSVVIANKKHQLTHLLERSHATKHGGRTKAYPHWETAQKIAEQLPERAREML